MPTVTQQGVLQLPQHRPINQVGTAIVPLLITLQKRDSKYLPRFVIT